MKHERGIIQLQLMDEMLNQSHICRQTISKFGRRDAQAKAGIVERDAPKAFTQPANDVAILKRPEWKAMEKQQDRPPALVNVMNRIAADINEVADERELALIEPAGSRTTSRE